MGQIVDMLILTISIDSGSGSKLSGPQLPFHLPSEMARSSSAVFPKPMETRRTLDRAVQTRTSDCLAQFFIKLTVSYHELNRPHSLKISS